MSTLHSFLYRYVLKLAFKWLQANLLTVSSRPCTFPTSHLHYLPFLIFTQIPDTPPIYHAIILCHCKLCFPYISKVVPIFTVHLDNLVHIALNYSKDAAFKRGTSTYYLQIYPLFVTKILLLECTSLFLTNLL